MVEKDKTFYWIKLQKDLLYGNAIDFLMSQKNGANYVVLYEMLIMNTINTQGKLCNEIGEVIMPFNIEKIQRDCKWFDVDTVRAAIELYSKLGLVYKNSEGILEIVDFENLVGSETYWAKQKRLKRAEGEKIIGHCPTNVQNPLISNIYNLNSSNINNNTYKKPSNSLSKTFEIIINENYDDSTIKDTLYEFIKMRKLINKPMTNRALELIISKLKTLSNGNPETAVKILNQSIINSWQGIFELKEEYKNKTESAFRQRKYTREELMSVFANVDELEV